MGQFCLYPSSLVLLSFLFSFSSFSSFSSFLSFSWTWFLSWLVRARSYHQPFSELDPQPQEALFILFSLFPVYLQCWSDLSTILYASIYVAAWLRLSLLGHISDFLSRTYPSLSTSSFSSCLFLSLSFWLRLVSASFQFILVSEESWPCPFHSSPWQYLEFCWTHALP